MKQPLSPVKFGPVFESVNIMSITDAETALQTLEHNLPTSDLAMLQNFNRAYLIITQAVRRALRQESFHDADFLNKFDTRFVFYYVDALRRYRSGRAIPKAWDSTFNAAVSHSYSPLMTMALGINAHVNNDIPQVLFDAAAGPEHYGDYVLVNALIRNSIYEVIDDLDNSHRLLNPKRKPLQLFYKPIMSCLIKIWRRSAWKKFEKLKLGTTTTEQIESQAERMAVFIKKLPI